MTSNFFHPSLLLLFLDPDPRWVKIRIRDVYPGSATLEMMTCKRTLRQVFVRVIDRTYSQLYWYSRPSFVNCCPSLPLSGSSLPLNFPPPFLV
jgi:hypothetical protein